MCLAPGREKKKTQQEGKVCLLEGWSRIYINSGKEGEIV